MRCVGTDPKRAGASLEARGTGVKQLGYAGAVPHILSEQPASLAHQPRRHPTVSDVAAAAGVSKSTVSRALRDSPLINAETKHRVLEAAERLGYAPSAIARSFRAQATPFVGVVVPDVISNLFARAVHGAQEVLEENGFQVLLMSSERDRRKEAAAVATLIAHRVGGILLSTSGDFAHCSVPVVFFDQLPTTPGLGVAEIAVDGAAGITLLARHLIEQHGHTRIAYLSGQTVTTARERRDAFERTLSEAGIPVPPDYLQVCDAAWSQESAQRATATLLELPDPPTAIVAASEDLAVGALRTLRRAGRRVPQEVAVVCFDDPAVGDLLDPPITAVSQHPEELGRRAAVALLEHLVRPAAMSPHVLLAPELVVRRSCGCGERA